MGGPRRLQTDLQSRTYSGDGTHSIVLTVLGVAGITVDRKKCRDVTRKKSSPKSPTDMKALVTISRDNEVMGSTHLSKALSISPKSNVVVSGEDTSSIKSDCSNRHVAVWASEDNASLGSMVAFDATMAKLDRGSRSSSSSDPYVPMSFAITLALAEDSSYETKVALPIGVANLTVSGDDFDDKNTMVLDIPLLSLKAARPLASNKNGLFGFQMISVSAENTIPTECPKEGFKTVFRRSSSKLRRTSSKLQKTPSLAERKAFSSVYATDEAGDAVIRVQLQVIDKARESSLVHEQKVDHPLPEHSESFSTSETRNTWSLKSGEDTASTEASGSVDSYTMSEESHDSIGTRTSQTDDSGTISTGSNSLEQTMESTVFDLANATRDRTNGSERDGRIYSSPIMMDGEDEDDGTFAFAEKDFNQATEAPQIQKEDDAIPDTTVFNVFGKHFRVPRCSPLNKKAPRTKARFFNEEMTHVTGDFFGHEFEIPICSGMKPQDYDEDMDDALTTDSATTFTNLGGTVDEAKRQVLSDYIKARAFSVSVSKESQEDHSSPDSAVVRDILQLRDTHVTTPLVFQVETPKPANIAEPAAKDQPPASEPSRVIQSFTNIFQCGTREAREATRVEVPDLVIPDDGNSVGDLTAITHERRIDRKPKVGVPSTRGFPLPAAFGGAGLCADMTTITDLEGGAALPGDGPYSTDQRVLTARENYFADYDDYSFLRPRTSESNRTGVPVLLADEC